MVYLQENLFYSNSFNSKGLFDIFGYASLIEKIVIQNNVFMDIINKEVNSNGKN